MIPGCAEKRRSACRLLGVGTLLAVLMGTGGCGGDRSSGGAASDRLAEVAYWLRYEGSVIGARALEDRFGPEGFSAASLGVAPADLSRFLAASQYALVCLDSAEPVVAYYGPLYRNVLLTRWAMGRTIELRGVRVVGPAELPGNGQPGSDLWIAALEQLAPGEGFNSVAASLHERRTETVAATDVCDGPWSDHGTATTARLLSPLEVGGDLSVLYDSSRYVAALNRSLLEAFNLADPDGLAYLLNGRYPELVDRLRSLDTRLQLEPIWLNYRESGDHARTVLVYADLSRPGAYLALASRSPRLNNGPDGASDLLLRLEPFRL